MKNLPAKAFAIDQSGWAVVTCLTGRYGVAQTNGGLS